jgi:putative oxidoreductase
MTMSILTATTQTWATVPIRIALGTIMFAHGSQKVLGVWGGQGLEKWVTDTTVPFDLNPSWAWLGAAAFSEFLGGLLVLIGLFTRVGAFFIACVMAVAVAGVHWNNGFFLPEGFEYPYALLCMAVTLLILGGGKISVDARLPGKK